MHIQLKIEQSNSQPHLLFPFRQVGDGSLQSVHLSRQTVNGAFRHLQGSVGFVLNNYSIQYMQCCPFYIYIFIKPMHDARLS